MTSHGYCQPVHVHKSDPHFSEQMMAEIRWATEVVKRRAEDHGATIKDIIVSDPIDGEMIEGGEPGMMMCTVRSRYVYPVEVPDPT